MKKKPDDMRQIHYIPGEILVVIDTNSVEREQICEEVIDVFNYEFLEDGYFRRHMVELGYENIEINVTVDLNSVSVFEYPNHDTDTQNRAFATVQLIQRMDSEYDLVEVGTVFVSEFMQLYLEELNDPDSEGTSSFVAVTPNWLVSGTAGPKACGGPGDKPQPVTNNNMPDFQVIGEDFLFAGQDANYAVDVVVLDTIPLSARNESSNFELPTGVPEQDIDDVLKQLRDPSVLKIVENNSPPPQGFDELDTDKYDGEMSDHGLFIAGIIHKIAPGANLTLYEVLNKYGVGDANSLIKGIRYALDKNNRTTDPNDESKKVPLIINMSLTLTAPLLPNQQHTPPNGVALKREALNLIQRRRGILEKKLADIQKADDYVAPSKSGKPAKSKKQKIDDVINEMIANLEVFVRTIIIGLEIAKSQADEVYILAAAGNDWETGKDRPLARYPAMYVDVTGVSALNHKNGVFSTAKYSNFADQPLSKGIATLGTEIIGPYLKHGNGLAKWSGTSFATGVVSGIFARRLQMNRADPTPDVVNLTVTAEPPERINVIQNSQ